MKKIANVLFHMQPSNNNSMDFTRALSNIAIDDNQTIVFLLRYRSRFGCEEECWPNYILRKRSDWDQCFCASSLRWRHNGHDGVSNHQPHHCLLNRLFGCRSKKHQSSASLAFVRGIHRGPVNFPHKWPVTRKMFPFDDVIMYLEGWLTQVDTWTYGKCVGDTHQRSVWFLMQRCKWSTRIKSISLRMSITFTGCKLTISWWRHQMETFSALLAICAGNSPVSGEFPAQRPVTRSFDVFFDLRPNKRLSKPSRGWWFETLSNPLWRHRNVYQYARAVSDRGAAFDACRGFMDGTTGPIARPTENQRVTFSVMVINLNLHVVLDDVNGTASVTLGGDQLSSFTIFFSLAVSSPNNV